MSSILSENTPEISDGYVPTTVEEQDNYILLKDDQIIAYCQQLECIKERMELEKQNLGELYQLDNKVFYDYNEDKTCVSIVLMNKFSPTIYEEIKHCLKINKKL